MLSVQRSIQRFVQTIFFGVHLDYLYKGVSQCLVMGSFPSFMGPKDKNPEEAGKTVEVKGRKKKYLEELPVEDPFLEETSMSPQASKKKDKKVKRETSRKVN